MDDIDRAILGELVHNGRASHRRLGAVAGLSANAAAERMRRLVRAGAITGFTAVVDQAAAGRGLSALIDVRLAREQTNDGFERALAQVDGVVYAAHVTGGFDYHLQVACRDTAALDALLRTLQARARRRAHRDPRRAEDRRQRSRLNPRNPTSPRLRCRTA